METRQIQHGSDEHLSLLGAPYHWNLLTGVDRADMLAFGRACMAAERERCAKLCDNYEPIGREGPETTAHELSLAIRWCATFG